MAQKKFWSGILGRKKESKEEAKKRGKQASAESEEISSERTSDLPVEELPSEKCRLCYEDFTLNSEAYKCSNCSTFYHYPKCLKNQTSCRVCGEKIVELGNIARLIRLKNVVCPKCGMKIKLFYGTESKLHVNCPSCGREGFIPNPYLGDTGPHDIHEEEGDEDEFEEEDEVAGEEEEEIETEEEIQLQDDDSALDIDLAAEQDAEGGGGPSIIRPDKAQKRKPKLVVLDESKTCNVCLGTIKTGLNVVVCRCGKYYHDSCADRVKFCPICDADFIDIENLVGEQNIELSAEDLEAFAEPEPQLELELKLNEHNTFEEFTVNDQNRIIHTITQGIAQTPGKEFNSVYIFGSQDLGKTHLLQAIGNHIQKSDSDSKVRYATILQFFSEFERANEIQKKDQFEEYYREADVFLIDDFQEFPKKKSDQAIFFKILDNLLDNNKQIVITSDRAIDEIKNLNKKAIQKLISKCGIIINLFESGLINK
jgi:Cdc6-like AAA superfamily ATPase